MSSVKGKRYEIHDNGSRPFNVYVNSAGKKVSVYRRIYPKENSEEYTEKLILETKYKEVFIGDMLIDDWDMSFGKGNSILINTKGNEYIFVGEMIYSFETADDEKIVRYHSPIGNNDVPCPVAEGEKNAYFMLHKKFAPLFLFNMDKDLYTQFLGIFNEMGGTNPEKREQMEKHAKDLMETASTKFKIKMIHKRVL